MPKNDEGEFELVLGNRQLISVFLIVVVLLGVFFSMGYIVGRNSSPATADTARNEKPKPEHDADSSNGSTPDAPADESATRQPPRSRFHALRRTDPRLPRSPGQPPISSARETAAARAKTSQAIAVATPRVRPCMPPLRESPRAASIGRWWPRRGRTPRSSPKRWARKDSTWCWRPRRKDGIFRVLVGPLPDAPTQAQTRTGLESAGFKNPIMRKY